MIEIIISAADSKQRVDKYIARLLPGAGKSLIYKQIRKKNITLNKKKMTGSEILNTNDTLQFFFSEDTFNKFSNATQESSDNTMIEKSLQMYTKNQNIELIYEDSNILCINKPIGILSQTAGTNELSLNEWAIGYLANSGHVTNNNIKMFKPSILNRLDKNTTGLILVSKSLLGANTISKALRERSIQKYYLTIVKGNFTKNGIHKAFHYKDEKNNKVTISVDKNCFDDLDNVSEIQTGFEVIQKVRHEALGDLSLLKVHLITGKSHQIRAHLSYLGYPVLGDTKYGDAQSNKVIRNYGISTQMLHSYQMIMPDTLPVELKELEGIEIICKPPAFWRKLNVNMEI